jgi:hypothetical protein
VDDAVRFMDVVIVGLWIALAIAVGVLVLAAAAVVGRFVSTRLERRYLPDVSRWSRRRASLPEDAGPWACPACSSVNASTVVRCYRCGSGRAPEARELAEAAADPSVYHRPEPVNRFDPGLYRGPGAPVAPLAGAARPAPTPGATPPDPAAPDAPTTEAPAG